MSFLKASVINRHIRYFNLLWKLQLYTMHMVIYMFIFIFIVLEAVNMEWGILLYEIWDYKLENVWEYKTSAMILTLTDLIWIISTVVVAITAEAGWNAVPIGTSKILMITGHRLCREESTVRQLKWHSYPKCALWVCPLWTHWRKKLAEDRVEAARANQNR